MLVMQREDMLTVTGNLVVQRAGPRQRKRRRIDRLSIRIEGRVEGFAQRSKGIYFDPQNSRNVLYSARDRFGVFRLTETPAWPAEETARRGIGN